MLKGHLNSRLPCQDWRAEALAVPTIVNAKADILRSGSFTQMQAVLAYIFLHGLYRGFFVLYKM